MNCTVAQKLLQLYLDNALEDVEARAVEHHVAHCAACRAYFLDLERVVLAIETLPRVAAPPDLFQKTMNKVMEEGQRGQRMPWWRWATVGLMALSAVAGLGFVLQTGPELAEALSELELSDPFDLVDGLWVVVGSAELSLAVGAGLLFISGCAGLLQLVSGKQAVQTA